MEIEEIIKQYLGKESQGKKIIVIRGYDDLDTQPFEESLSCWSYILEKQLDIWENGERILGMEDDWCGYVRRAWSIIPKDIRNALRQDDHHQTIPKDLQ